MQSHFAIFKHTDSGNDWYGIHQFNLNNATKKIDYAGSPIMLVAQSMDQLYALLYTVMSDLEILGTGTYIDATTKKAALVKPVGDEDMVH